MAAASPASSREGAAALELQLLSLKLASREEVHEETAAQLEACKRGALVAAADRAALQERANAAAETSIVAIERLQEHVLALEGAMGQGEAELLRRISELTAQLAAAAAATSAAEGKLTAVEAAAAEADVKTEATTRVLVEFGASTGFTDAELRRGMPVIADVYVFSNVTAAVAAGYF